MIADELIFTSINNNNNNRGVRTILTLRGRTFYKSKLQTLRFTENDVGNNVITGFRDVRLT